MAVLRRETSSEEFAVDARLADRLKLNIVVSEDGQSFEIDGATEYCGVVLVGGSPRILLPKEARGLAMSEADQWHLLRSVLPTLLRYSHFPRCEPEIGDEKQAAFSDYNSDVGSLFLEMLLAARLNGLRAVLEHVARPNFSQFRELLQRPRGSISWPETLNQSHGLQHQAVYRYCALDYEHPYYQIVRVGLCKLSNFVSALSKSKRASGIDDDFRACLYLSEGWPEDQAMAFSDVTKFLAGSRHAPSFLEPLEPFVRWLSAFLFNLFELPDARPNHPPLPSILLNLNYVLEHIINRAMATQGKVACKTLDGQILWHGFEGLGRQEPEEQVKLSLTTSASPIGTSFKKKTFEPDCVAHIESENVLAIIDAKHSKIVRVETDVRSKIADPEAVFNSERIYQMVAYGSCVPQMLRIQSETVVTRLLLVGLVESSTVTESLEHRPCSVAYCICDGAKGPLESPNVILAGLPYNHWLLKLGRESDEEAVLRELGGELKNALTRLPA